MRFLSKETTDIEEIVAALRAGQTIVYPTETCYGLGCDANNQSAVDKIFEIKQRQRTKPLLVLMADKAMAMRYVRWSKKIESLSKKYWPGPLTLVAAILPDAEKNLAAGIVGYDHMLAFRVTDYPLANDLSSRLGRPLVSTSANIASLESPYDISSVRRMFEGQRAEPDIVIDAGELPYRSSSTIVRVNGRGVEVLRQGEIVVHDA